jgi:L-iditol 2-dehydrogenase
MIAATYTQGGSFSIMDVPDPQIESDEILLRINAAAICGTDLKIIRSGHRKLAEGQRIVLGHEFVGVIEKIGARVKDYEVGQRVGVAPNAGCGHCDACIRGKSNYCPRYTAFGIDRDGGQASFTKIPSRFLSQGNVIPLPDSISDHHAALLEPFSCVVNGIRNTRMKLGDSVAVFGVGPIGLLHVMLSRISGAAQIIAVDPVEERLERAMNLGCDQVINPREQDVTECLRAATDGRGVDVVITACAQPDVQTEAVRLLAPFGRLCLFGGLPRDASTVAMDTNAVHYGNLIVTGSTGGSVEDYRMALRLVAGGRVDLSSIISDVFSFDKLPEAYDTALSGANGKVLLSALY